ncbi:MAG: diiron oxygenase [Pseudonocardiales bacterium]|nr:diiron oxygenase [Pseudonocardiales bacterium]MBV9729244.1 diiron oxygenase [Pseudonocardiales bacterium]
MTSAVDTTAQRIPDREDTARRLLRTSAKHSYDPATEIDWDAPLAPDRYFIAAHRSSLYGTALWDRMSEEQRIALTKHEVASFYSIGIWFETILMQMLIRHVYDRPKGSAHARYAWTEIADECRHSVMFSRMAEKFGAPEYGPGAVVHHLGRLFKTVSNGTLTFGATIYVEEILDVLQREQMVDQSLQPVVQEVSRIHVIEEARHIRYAREETLRQWPRLGPLGRAYSRFILAVVVYFATTRLVDPKVYAAVGLDVDEAVKAAAANPYWRQTKQFAARKVVAFLDEVGLIAGPGKLLWRRAGVL